MMFGHVLFETKYVKVKLVQLQSLRNKKASNCRVGLEMNICECCLKDHTVTILMNISVYLVHILMLLLF